jgi:hypothetical protein
LRSKDFISKRDVLAPGAGRKANFATLADVPRFNEADRHYRRNRQQNCNTIIVPDPGQKPKEKAQRKAFYTTDFSRLIG